MTMTPASRNFGKFTEAGDAKKYTQRRKEKLEDGITMTRRHEDTKERTASRKERKERRERKEKQEQPHAKNAKDAKKS